VFACVGVPEIIALDKVSPGGKPKTPLDPVFPAVQPQVYGPLPPDAVRRNPLPAYALPAVPDGGAADVIAKGGGVVVVLVWG